MDIYDEIIEKIISGEITNKEELHMAKRGIAIKHGLQKFPKNSEILEKAGKHRKKVIDVLQRKPTRTMSGIASIAVMTSPEMCPHGKCAYCFGGTDINTPQSYAGKEPAAMRGGQLDYNPFTQTHTRIQQLEMIGHSCEKIELIVMGGTFTGRKNAYQKNFIKRCFDGMNGVESSSLERAKYTNEKAKHRCIGLTIETRPDYCEKRHINQMLDLGATRVELGVQHPDNDIYFKISRGHSVENVVEATRLCKDSGLKVGYHIMPNLPGSTYKKDLDMFAELYNNPDFKPDMLKIYPTLLLDPKYGETELHEMWKNKEWKPYGEEKTVELIARAKSTFPKWTRVMRVQRDVPSPIIFRGVQASNLRQFVHERMKKDKTSCDCIRCREIRDDTPKDPKLMRTDYEASGGQETFISFEDKNKMIGFLRLRKPNKPFRKEINKNTALVRELHIYGPVVPLGDKPDDESQHRGFGKRLVEEAERIANEDYDCKKLAIRSAIGVRPYYSNLGYELDGEYMSKTL